MDDIFAKSGDEKYDELTYTIAEIEKEYGAEILFAGFVRSHTLGLRNAASDYDVNFIFRRAEQDGRKFFSHAYHFGDFDAICKDISLLEESNWSVPGEMYPSYEHRDKTDLKNILIDDNNRALVIRTVFGRHMWDERGFVRNNLPYVRNFLRVPRILDTCYTKLSVHWDNYVNNGTPSMRSYMYALHEILTARWVVENNTIPPVGFLELLETCDDSAAVEEAYHLCELNKRPIRRIQVSVDRVEALDHYIVAGKNWLYRAAEQAQSDAPDKLLDALLG